jgi:hypothetical protein
MGLDPRDNDVLQLLKKLKDANGTYPQELLAARRQGYLKQVAEVSGGAGLAVALRNTIKNTNGAGTGAGAGTSLSPLTGTIVEALLVAAIVAEAGAVTYFYRDKITQLYQSITSSPKVEEVANPPVAASPISIMSLPTSSASPVATGTELVTPTATPIGTPTLLAAQPTNPAGGSASGGGTTTQGGTPAASTPSGGAVDPNGNNGNHYGQTPIPERTKESGNTDTAPNNTDTHNQNDQVPRRKD